MKYKLLISMLCGASILSCTHNPKATYVVIDGFAQGSTYHFVVDQADTSGLQLQIDSLINQIDNSVSLYNNSSLLSRINRGHTDSVDQHIAYCVESSRLISELSDGAFDITIKPITAAWGFAGKEATENPNIDSLMQFVGYKRISINNGILLREDPAMQLDLNASSQGYTADLLGQLMESRGIENYLVEIGGEVFCKGVNSKGEQWKVGIDKPYEGNFTPGATLQTAIRLTSGEGLATSGNYRKYRTDAQGRKIVHTIDAKTGYSRISNLLSATVVAQNATMADLYGTMFMIIGLDSSKAFLAEHPELKAYLIYSDTTGTYQTFATPNLQITEIQ